MSKIRFSIEYAGLQLPILKNEAGEDVTPLKPISDLFGLRWETQRRKVADNPSNRSFLGICTPPGGGAGGQKRDLTCILLSRVAVYLLSINADQVRVNGNADGADFLEKKQREWADALHDYEELGVAVNLNHARAIEVLRKQRASFAQMIGVKNKTADLPDRRALGQVVKQMAGELGIAYQPDLVDGQ